MAPAVHCSIDCLNAATTQVGRHYLLDNLSGGDMGSSAVKRPPVLVDVPGSVLSSSATTSANPSPSPTGIHSSGAEPHHRHSTILKAAIVGGVLGGLFVLLLILIPVCCTPSKRAIRRNLAEVEAAVEAEGVVERRDKRPAANLPVVEPNMDDRRLDKLE
ncbi:hypothetical protein MIND_00640100 [Mycena indigotica]|uniref:Uncharacterized protein n=1 Tax=Mycena indigotica TaxID=2126181 RepID=A0A8H6SRC5_9AGAR|nr:uncharacterized protein MIND_00640100 [Mycena indigotica]KAF7304086.1 hypothetical protein MIND_00640100 [Mycena indigotica]